MSGTVIDGGGNVDLEFTAARAKVEASWNGYSDPESTIRQYRVQVEKAV